MFEYFFRLFRFLRSDTDFKIFFQTFFDKVTKIFLTHLPLASRLERLRPFDPSGGLTAPAVPPDVPD